MITDAVGLLSFYFSAHAVVAITALASQVTHVAMVDAVQSSGFYLSFAAVVADASSIPCPLVQNMGNIMQVS